MGIGGIKGGHSYANVTSVSSVSPAVETDGATATAPASRQQGSKRDVFRSDFSNLVSAVRSGDIAAAQTALTSLQSDVTSTSTTYSPTSTSPTSTAPTASSSQNDLTALFTAVRAGDVEGAKAALGQLELDVKSSGPHADRASLQGQIHGRGHGNQGSNLWTAVAAAFQAQTTAPAATTSPVVDPVIDPVVDPVVDPVGGPAVDPVVDPVVTEPVAQVPVLDIADAIERLAVQA